MQLSQKTYLVLLIRPINSVYLGDLPQVATTLSHGRREVLSSMADGGDTAGRGPQLTVPKSRYPSHVSWASQWAATLSLQASQSQWGATVTPGLQSQSELLLVIGIVGLLLYSCLSSMPMVPGGARAAAVLLCCWLLLASHKTAAGSRVLSAGYQIICRYYR